MLRLILTENCLRAFNDVSWFRSSFCAARYMKKQRVVVGRTSHVAALKYHLDFDIFTLDLELTKVSHHLFAVADLE